MEENVTKPDADTATYLKRIADGVMMILWILVAAIVFWPLSQVIASYTDSGETTNLTNAIAVGVSIAVGYLVTRLVFPVEYASGRNRATDETR